MHRHRARQLCPAEPGEEANGGVGAEREAHTPAAVEQARGYGAISPIGAPSLFETIRARRRASAGVCPGGGISNLAARYSTFAPASTQAAISRRSSGVTSVILPGGMASVWAACR
jgi:hypothetical protein